MAASPPAIVEDVRERLAAGQPVCVKGSGSKAAWYAPPQAGAALSTLEHAGVVAFEPTELVVTAHAGTRLADLNERIAAKGLRLPFEPPDNNGTGTLGGAIASGLSGPARPYGGNVRDAVLGLEMVNGLGEHLRFGGQVMKNVAGYDLSRLQVGAHGVFGLILTVSLRLQPMPQTERSFRCVLAADDALSTMRRWAREPLPLSATAYVGDRFYWRLSGSQAAVSDAQSTIARELSAEADSGEIWQDLNTLSHAFYRRDDGTRLWCVLQPPASPIGFGADSVADGEWLIEWNGAKRWLASSAEPAAIERAAGKAGALVHQLGAPPPLDAQHAPLVHRIKQAFDPECLFNRDLLDAH